MGRGGGVGTWSWCYDDDDDDLWCDDGCVSGWWAGLIRFGDDEVMVRMLIWKVAVGCRGGNACRGFGGEWCGDVVAVVVCRLK
ncbi:hypothetical protein Tco_0493185 [Tanacetum coccineum]